MKIEHEMVKREQLWPCTFKHGFVRPNGVIYGIFMVF